MSGNPLQELNSMLSTRGIDPVVTKMPAKPFDDDIPF
jgi:hypothetical protein